MKEKVITVNFFQKIAFANTMLKNDKVECLFLADSNNYLLSSFRTE